MLVGLNEQVRRLGVAVTVRATVPVKPFTGAAGATVMVDIPVTVALTMTPRGLAAMLKSATDEMLKS